MSSARHLAITLLNQCDASKHTLDYLLDKSARHIEQLNRQDRSLFHAIVYGVLRWQHRLDWIIDQLSTRPGKKIDPLVRNVLRMGLFQILHLDRVPPSAAVNTSVQWVKKNHRSWAAGFVNGLLRRAATRVDNISWPDEKKHPVQSLAVRHAFPSWLITRWIDRLGVNETIQLCQAINTIAPITLRTNTLKTKRPKLMTAINKSASQIEATRYSPEGIRFVSPTPSIAQWGTFGQGHFQIQNEASQLIAHLLSPMPGHRVWDACAGLGTKTAHIAQLMHNQGHLLATDHSSDKLSRLKSEMQRLSITIVETHCVDLGSASPPSSKFDRILLDAPCSGLGVLQNNPDGKWRTQPKALEKNAARQLAFLERTLPHLATDGILVYAVCSTEPEENEDVINHFLQKHREFGIHIGALEHVTNADNLISPNGWLRTQPHHHQMDGFFAVALKKKDRHPILQADLT